MAGLIARRYLPGREGEFPFPIAAIGR